MNRHWVYAAAEDCRDLVQMVPVGESHVYREHLIYMLDEIAKGEMSSTKACRWLGWVQAALYMHSIVPLEDLKRINRAAATINTEWMRDLGRSPETALEIEQAAIIRELKSQPADDVVVPREIVYGIGRWLSAALDDDHVCAEMKKDIEAWMEATK